METMIKIELLDESSVFAAISEDGEGRNSLLALPGAFALSGFKSALSYLRTPQSEGLQNTLQMLKN
jgi:hypothetical protein